MKIDKHNPEHWLYLVRSGIYLIVGLCVRPMRSRRQKTVILYGHKLNGNLKAFADYIERTKSNIGEYSLAFATLDPRYYRELCDSGTNIEVLSLNKLQDAIRISCSSAIITSHGLHTLALLKALTNNIKFINVWHGIGWKGHEAREFSFTDKYADNWVSSPVFKSVYQEVFGVKSPVHVTGYARTDDAVDGRFDVNEIKKRYRIAKNYKKIILIAPTWEQKHNKHNIYPYRQNGDDFFRSINKVAKSVNSLVIFRSHLNSRVANPPKGLSNLVFMPYDEYPVVEDFLYMADILISDWSSIVFDYLPLKRPTIFFDVPSPYEKLCIDGGYRFGAKAASMDELTDYIKTYTLHPEVYTSEYEANMHKSIMAGYGDTLDGESAKRYHQRLLELIK